MHEQDKRLHAVICHVAHNKTSPAASAAQGTKEWIRFPDRIEIVPHVSKLASELCELLLKSKISWVGFAGLSACSGVSSRVSRDVASQHANSRVHLCLEDLLPRDEFPGPVKLPFLRGPQSCGSL